MYAAASAGFLLHCLLIWWFLAQSTRGKEESECLMVSNFLFASFGSFCENEDAYLRPFSGFWAAFTWKRGNMKASLGKGKY